MRKIKYVLELFFLILFVHPYRLKGELQKLTKRYQNKSKKEKEKIIMKL